MVFFRRIIALAALFQISLALVKFKYSLLFDEYDLLQTVSIPNLCNDGCRVYASVPVASADVMQNMMVKSSGQADMSLYAIAKIANPYEKGFLEVQGNVEIVNNNAGNGTAPVAVWIVSTDAVANIKGKVFDAADLPSVAHPIINPVTVMSAELFTLRSKTDGPMRMVATLSGCDVLYTPMVFPDADSCINVITLMEPTSYSDIQINVRSPLITLNFDGRYFEDTKILLSAEFGKETLDFSGETFAASPGFIGCNDQKTYRSSLYDAESANYLYYSYNRAYDVRIYAVLTTDAGHPVTIEDKTNKNEYNLSVASPDMGKWITQTNNIAISWTRNVDEPDQSFLIWLDHTNEQPIAPSDDDCDGIFEDICYFIGADADNWQDAQEICKRSGAKLASVHNSEANSFIRRLAVSRGDVNGLMLGANLSANKKNFEWIDKSDWDFENFYPEFPMNWLGDCLAMDTSSTAGQWVNTACTSNLPVVCERK